MTLKKYTPDKILLSPRLARLLNDESLQFLVDHLDELTAQPARELEFDRGSVKTWGIEIADAEDAGRTYRALAAIEEEFGRHGKSYLTLLALEEHPALEQTPLERAAGPGWETRSA